MSYKPRVVANALLHKAAEEGSSLTHLKLQKLLFFVQAWGLALHDDEVMAELPEAWTYGPVYASLYHELKTYGSGEIAGYLKEPDVDTGALRALVPNPGDKKFWALLDRVWDRYGHLTAAQLSSLSHLKGGPWDDARQSQMTNMSKQAITEFYRKKLEENAAN